MVTVLFKTERVIKGVTAGPHQTVTLLRRWQAAGCCGAYHPDMGDQRDFPSPLRRQSPIPALFSKALYECFPGGTANVQPVDTLPDVKRTGRRRRRIQLLLMIQMGSQQRPPYARSNFCHTYLYTDDENILACTFIPVIPDQISSLNNTSAGAICFTKPGIGGAIATAFFTTFYRARAGGGNAIEVGLQARSRLSGSRWRMASTITICC